MGNEADYSHMSKERREHLLRDKGQEVLCANMYNDYKCWKNTRCCEYLKDNKKCSAFVEIKED